MAKPLGLKVLQGTVQKCRDGDKLDHAEFELCGEPPEAPAWLTDAHAVEEWDRLARILHGNGVLTVSGLSSLAVLCSMHGQIVGMFKTGECPTGTMMTSYILLVKEFGLTPVAQGKVRPSEKKKQNRFGNNGQKLSANRG